jgi:hypothetical protein
MKVLIQHWDAVELVAHIICKLEQKNIKEFHDYDVLQKYLEFYSNIEQAKAASISSLDTTNTLSNLIRMIRTKEPVTITKKELTAIEKYIGEENKVPVQLLDVIWRPKSKATLFIGRWWLYSYDEIDSEPCIVRSVMTLRPFNKAIIDSLQNDTGNKQRYVGKYHIYGINANYMNIILHTEETEEKDLQMLFYVGSEIPEIALGQYHNVEGTIYSGTAVIERALTRGSTTAKYFKFKDNTEQSEIPTYIWDYFKDKHLNSLRVPAFITSEEKFVKWLEFHKAKRNPEQA